MQVSTETTVKKARNLVAGVPSTPSALAGLVQQVVETPKATPKAAPKAAPVGSTLKLVVTTKGSQYTPKNGKKPNNDSWATIKAAVLANPTTISELLALVPQHKDFVTYAVRQQWLAAA